MPPGSSSRKPSHLPRFCKAFTHRLPPALAGPQLPQHAASYTALAGGPLAPLHTAPLWGGAARRAGQSRLCTPTIPASTQQVCHTCWPANRADTVHVCRGRRCRAVRCVMGLRPHPAAPTSQPTWHLRPAPTLPGSGPGFPPDYRPFCDARSGHPPVAGRGE